MHVKDSLFVIAYQDFVFDLVDVEELEKMQNEEGDSEIEKEYQPLTRIKVSKPENEN